MKLNLWVNHRGKMTFEEFTEAVARTRIQPMNIGIPGMYLVTGMRVGQVARKCGVTPERVRELVARVLGAAKKT